MDTKVINKFEKIKYFENKKIEPGMIHQNQADKLVTYLIDVIHTNPIDGDVVEFGCYVGESSKYLQKTLTEFSSHKRLYVYDSFEGLPELGEHEENTGWKAGTLDTTEEIFLENFSQNNLPAPFVTKGWFKDIPLEKIPEKICFAFLDGDFYESIYDSLSKVYDRVVDGGHIIFHDYERSDLPGVKAAIEDFFKERNDEYNVVKVCDQLGVITKNRTTVDIKTPEEEIMEDFSDNDLTVVTGLWDINRPNRDFSHYIANFQRFLEIPQKMFIYISKEYEHLVWEKRSKHNTFVKTYELDDIKRLYDPFWEKTQSIREDQNWLQQATWLPDSPQASSEWYNPIVQSKMFMLNDATIWNPFNTEHFIWLDAGIMNTVNGHLLVEENALDKIVPHLDSFLFLSYPYEANTEIHGFSYPDMNRYSGANVKYVCRGGLFGGRKDYINDANAEYYTLLKGSLSENLMGTEESIFTIMSYIEPDKYKRYALDDNGFIVKFVEALINDNVTLEKVKNKRYLDHVPNTRVSISDKKVSIYMLSFNFPEQVESTIKTWLKHPKWITDTRNILIDNSTNEKAIEKNKELCEKYNFEHMVTNKNLGICGGRFLAAEHFQESDSDYYLFLEDDMEICSPSDNGFCRNGFRKHVPNLYDKLLKIMEGDDVDFLKLSFTEVYMDNNIQVSWYNVPQHIRTQQWPYYDRLPVSGLDKYCPRTNFDKIEVVDGLSYIKGEIYYANWPMIVGKEGNQKMFLDITWAHPYEQTWMSQMYQDTLEGKLKPAILLASPINHNRILYYQPEERKENAG